MPKPIRNISRTAKTQVFDEMKRKDMISMKKIVSLILAVLCIALTLCACNGNPDNNPTSQSGVSVDEKVYTEGDFNYVILADGTAKVVKYNKKDAPTDLRIPANFGKIKVTAIGKDAFTSDQNVINVELSRFITTIESGAFNKSPLKSIKFLDAKVETIESMTFSECDNLLQVVFNDSVKRIKDSAFYLGRMPRVIHFTVDPVEISSKALDIGKNYDNLEIKHHGDISNFRKLEEFANLFGIELVLVKETVVAS